MSDAAVDGSGRASKIGVLGEGINSVLHVHVNATARAKVNDVSAASKILQEE